jgi:hypothetical protein
VAQKPLRCSRLLVALLLISMPAGTLESLAQQKCLDSDFDPNVEADVPVTTVVWGIDGLLAYDVPKNNPTDAKAPPVGSYIYRIAVDLTNQKATVTDWFLTPSKKSVQAGGRGLYISGVGTDCFDANKNETCMIYYTIAKGSEVLLATATKDKIKDQPPLFDAAALCGAKCDKIFNDGIADLTGQADYDIWLNAYRQEKTIYHYEKSLKDNVWSYTGSLILKNSTAGFDGLEVVPGGGFVANWYDFKTPDKHGNFYTQYDKTGKVVGADKFIATTNIPMPKYGTGIVFDSTNKIFIVSAYKDMALLVYDVKGKFSCSIPLKSPNTTYAPCGGLYGKMCLEDLSWEPPPPSH